MTDTTAPINTLLFDWDGTLNDSALDGFTAFQKSLDELGFAFTQEFYEANYSPNWYTMYETLRLPREQWQRADELWIHHYGEAPARLVEGARETVIELHKRGYRLGIVTSGSHCRVTRELSGLGLTSVFQVVVCNEHIVNKKPHPEGLEQAMRLIGSCPEECSYVGDAPEDIHMGKRARVHTVAVRSSYPTSKHLLSAGPDIYLDSISELLLHFHQA
ncbi:MAG TPA: HAD-IA family hydrolase [Pyrinomonadaceae bacterium]|jgi:HAD superfamily hydrolase (TIGR01509 family)|nr:HAD-IA family hydrolase [Pyrinomonadaceae bacterium]